MREVCKTTLPGTLSRRVRDNKLKKMKPMFQHLIRNDSDDYFYDVWSPVVSKQGVEIRRNRLKVI